MDCSHIVLHDALALAALDQAVEMCGPSLNPPLRCLLDCLFVCLCANENRFAAAADRRRAAWQGEGCGSGRRVLCALLISALVANTTAVRACANSTATIGARRPR